MPEAISKGLKTILAIFYMQLILAGYITSPEQIPGNVNPNELQSLAGAIQCENGDCDKIKCPFLTGIVIMNRLHSPRWIGNSIDEVINAKDSGYWQYAYTTRRDYKTKKCNDRSLLIAKYLLIYYQPDLQAEKEIIFQGRNKNAGSGVAWDDDHGEYFCYE